MVREASLIAFKRIKESGVLSERRIQVLELLVQHGPCTGSELALKYKAKYGSLAF
jgi:DNA-binding MarR family transcriptional regulator